MFAKLSRGTFFSRVGRPFSAFILADSSFHLPRKARFGMPRDEIATLVLRIASSTRLRDGVKTRDSDKSHLHFASGKKKPIQLCGCIG